MCTFRAIFRLVFIHVRYFSICPPLRRIKVYVKSCDPDCKILHILVSLNGIVVLSFGFVSEHKALDFKPILDVKMKIWSAENEDEKFSIFQEIEFPL